MWQKHHSIRYFEKGKVIALGRRIALDLVVTVFIFLTVLSGQAQAFQVINEENVYIPPSKTLEGPIVWWAERELMETLTEIWW